MNILLTSVGRRGYLIKYFKEALSDTVGGKIFAANSTDTTPAFQYADETVVTPLIYDKGYIDFLLCYCKKNNIEAIISLFDIDLPILAKHKRLFKDNGITVIVSDLDVVNICNDKWKTYNFLKDNDINCPKTYISLHDAKREIECEKIKFPLIIKPRWGMGSIGVFVTDDIDELKVLYKKTKKEIEKTYLKYEAAYDFEHCVIIQEMIDGQEYGLDVINDLKGNYQNTIIKEKYAMRAGETDCAKIIECSKLQEIGENLSKKVKHIGNLDCDVFLKNGEPYVLEMNARFGGGYPFSHVAGVNLPLAIIKWLNSERVDKSVLTADIGVVAHKDITIKML